MTLLPKRPLVVAVGCALASPQRAMLACALRSSSSQKSRALPCDFRETLFVGATYYKNRVRSPLFLRAEGFRQQGSRKSQRSEIFGKRRSGARMRALPSGRCERAADCSDEGALFQRRGFGTRNLIKEKCNSICHPERSVA